jgi:hypothetical protein
MKIYTIREAARETKIGMEALKRACEEGLINATKLANSQWRIAESALAEALHNGIDLRGLPKKTGKKQMQPEGLRKAQEEMKKAQGQAATTTTKTATTPKTKTTKPGKAKK